jgi:hypothetical protein
MIVTYTYVCKYCTEHCQVSIRADSDSVLGKRIKECGWVPNSKCYTDQDTKANWVLYSIIPEALNAY